jgi:hypothetical protein
MKANFLPQFILSIILLFAVGCATAGRINNVSLGMSKSQVIDVMGIPDHTKAIYGQEVLVYNLYDSANDAFAKFGHEYWIVIREGGVVQYGRAGDFNSSIPAQ